MTDAIATYAPKNPTEAIPSLDRSRDLTAAFVARLMMHRKYLRRPFLPLSRDFADSWSLLSAHTIPWIGVHTEKSVFTCLISYSKKVTRTQGNTSQPPHYGLKTMPNFSCTIHILSWFHLRWSKIKLKTPKLVVLYHTQYIDMHCTALAE